MELRTLLCILQPSLDSVLWWLYFWRFGMLSLYLPSICSVKTKCVSFAVMCSCVISKSKDTICVKNLQNFNVDSFSPQNLFDQYCLFVCKECCCLWIKCQVLLSYQIWPKTQQCPFLCLHAWWWYRLIWERAVANLHQ